MKLVQVANLRLWQAASFEFLQSVVGRIESKCGRLNPWAVDGRGPITTHLKQVPKSSILKTRKFIRDNPEKLNHSPWSYKVRDTVEAGAHFKETTGLNFRTIPDPFGSYIKTLPPEG